jgi:hypothetical protein
MSTDVATVVAPAATGLDPDYAITGGFAEDPGTPSRAAQRLTEAMTTLVKGAGYAVTDKAYVGGINPGANQPLTDPEKVFSRSMRAEKAWKAAIRSSLAAPAEVYKTLTPEFRKGFGSFLGNTPQQAMMDAWTAQLQEQLTQFTGKNFTLTSPNATGLVPYNLVAPTRLIYPVYTPFRNKLPRTQGQGTSYQEKVVTGISGSQTGSSGGQVVNIGIPELVSGSPNMNNWPLNLPPSGVQDSVNILVPYRFSGLSENVSWLAQFAGQGFEDVAGLANLILLQEFMLGEEYMDIAGTSTALTTPSAPTVTTRNANSGETALSGTITSNILDVKVSAATWFGETAVSTAAAASSVTSGTSVVDVQIAPVAGALWYNIYVSVGSAPAATTYHLMVSKVGGLNYTLQGAVPTTGTLAPSSDTGTSSAYSQEGLVSVLSGHSAGNIYPTGWQGGYINQSVGDTLGISVINTALKGVYDGSGAFRADPAELVGEGGDIMRLSDDIVQSGNATNYRLFIQPTDTPGVRAGAAVSEFVNPVTRSIVRILVHPWFPQGTVLLMSYNLPFGWSNVGNAFEVNLVQDYLSISWPVIDATFRYSMFTYGAVVANAPQYSAILQGIQASDRSGSTGTWS